jgi:predicted transcriptional regulator
MGWTRMSHEWMIKTLLDAGLSKNDIEVYLFLTEAGAMEKKKIAQALKRCENEIYSCLDHLQNLRIIAKSPNQTSMLYALSFDETLGHLLEVKKEQAKDLQESKYSLLSTWRAITK